MTDKTSYLRDELAALVDQGLFNTITTIDGPQGPWLSVGGRDVLNNRLYRYDLPPPR